jgi:hypothetical protein
VTAPLWRGLCRRRSGRAPSSGVIRGAMGGVSVGFSAGLRRKVEKVTKKGRQNFLDGNFRREVGLRPKKGRQLFLAAHFPNF